MKVLSSLFFVLFSVVFFAQEVAEPDFIGETIIINNGNPQKLSKEVATITTRAGAGLYIVGVGKVRTRIELKPAKSKTRVKSGKDIVLIVKANDNNSDPLSIVNLFKFEEKKKKRRAEVASVGTFSGGEANKLNRIEFTAEKYGEASYKLTITTILEKGEYGVTVSNPNALDEKKLVVSTFGIN